MTGRMIFGVDRRVIAIMTMCGTGNMTGKWTGTMAIAMTLTGVIAMTGVGGIEGDSQSSTSTHV